MKLSISQHQGQILELRLHITHSEETTGMLKSCSEDFVQTDDPINTWGTIVPTDSENTPAP